MRATIAGLICAFYLVNWAHAQNLTQTNRDKTNKIIEQAVAAYGGDRLEEIKSIVRYNKDTNYATGQSLKAEPPWDQNSSEGFAAVDFENGRFANRASGEGGGFEFDNGTIIDGEASVQMNFRAGTVAPLSAPDFDTTSGPFIRVTPALLVKQLQEHSRTAHYLGETELEGRTQNVVGFSMRVGPAISLYIDKETNLLSKSERVLPGFGLVEYRFADFENIEGVPFNKKFFLYLNGDLNLDRTVTKTKINTALDKYMKPDKRLTQIAAVEPVPLSRQKIGEGVYLIGGNGTYAMFVEMEDHVVAVGGTAGIPDRIDLLKEVTDKPVKYGVLTHHHFDHVLGTQAYAEAGATILVHPAHLTVAKDSLQDQPNAAFESVKKKRVLKDKTQRVEIFDIGPTAHTEHLLVAWLPDQGILFEADHFALPASGPVPPAVSSTKSFAKALKKRGLKPTKIASAHSPRVATMEDLQAALDKQVLELTAELQ